MPDPIPATLIPGDGVGPKIIEVAVHVLERPGSPLAWDVQQNGTAAIASKVRSRDLGGTAGSAGFPTAVLAAL